ncbi:hypothetical protein [Microbulbifer sp. JMSA008]|uniref:hypothetical protein n=1 Tax=Microbulbifer sp. JMSA008 TaxID=3243373 RepID=UPI00403A74E9
MKWLNEIQHRVVAKIQVERLERHKWPENEFIEMVGKYISQTPGIGHLVGWAINRAYEAAIKQKT